MWDSTDTKENFNLRGNKKYNEDSIKYILNKYGFRLPSEQEDLSTNKRETIACFGCSQTFGVGLPYEETWPFLLEEMLHNKYTVKNYGISGASSDTIVRKMHNYLIKEKPKIICCLLPDIFRREMFTTTEDFVLRNFNELSGDENVPVQVKCVKAKFNFLDWRAYMRLFGEDNSLYYLLKNILLMELLCKQHGVQLWVNTWDQDVLKLIREKQFKRTCLVDLTNNKFKQLLEWENLGKARDGIHLGIEANELFAEAFAAEIQK
jgi:lysophospholipase L1-like esterase